MFLFNWKKKTIILFLLLIIIFLFSIYFRFNKTTVDITVVIGTIEYFEKYMDQNGKLIGKPEMIYTTEADHVRNFLNSKAKPEEEAGEMEDSYEILKNLSIQPESARIIGKKIFKNKKLVVWATEWHMTPIKDTTNILKDFGVKVMDLNLDPWRCQWHDCKAKEKLKVLTPQNVLDLTPPLGDKYVEAYKGDKDMQEVDVVYCGYPASLCQIYIKLNKSVLIQATTRYDVGRYTKDRLTELNNDFIALNKIKHNIISGNSLYDADFIKYYTGINTLHIPSICDYTGASYYITNNNNNNNTTNNNNNNNNKNNNNNNNNNKRINKFLVLRRRDNGFNKIFYDEFNFACKIINCSVKLGPLQNFNYNDLANHKAIIHVPYQISVMSIFEEYRMNIPMFVPSAPLLATWHAKHFIMPERTFEGAFKGQRLKKSIIEGHISQREIPDPKDEFNYKSILYWMEKSDFYNVFPYSIVYKSVPHLVHLLETITDDELNIISQKIKRYNIDFKKKILFQWKRILLNYARNSRNYPN